MEEMAKIAARLDKLRRNEELMTEEQKGTFKNQLRDFKKVLFSDSLKWLEWYLNTAVTPIAGDSGSKEYEELKKRTDEIMKFGIGKGWIRGLRKVLFKTYSLDAMLNAAAPWMERLRFEAYAPYWCGHCKRVRMDGSADWLNPSEGEAEFWRNDITGMIWDETSALWINPDGVAVRWGLPPTMELCEVERMRGKEKTA